MPPQSVAGTYGIAIGGAVIKFDKAGVGRENINMIAIGIHRIVCRQIDIQVAGIVNDNDGAIRHAGPIAVLLEPVIALRSRAGTIPAVIIIEQPAANIRAGIGTGALALYYKFNILFAPRSALGKFVDQQLGISCCTADNKAAQCCQTFVNSSHSFTVWV